MRAPYQFGMPYDLSSTEATKVGALINDLNRRIRMLESDIAREEELAGVSNALNAAYPLPARIMTAQRDNLKQTIEALQQRLPPTGSRVPDPLVQRRYHCTIEDAVGLGTLPRELK